MKEIQIYIHVSGGEMISESKHLKGQLGPPVNGENYMSHSQMLGKVESGGGPIFKKVLEC